MGETRVFARICVSSKLEHKQSGVETIMESTTHTVIYSVTNEESATLIV